MADEPTRINRPAPGDEPDVTRITPPMQTIAASPGPSAGPGGPRDGSFGVPLSGRNDRAEIKVGEILGFTYRIEALLAKGGMGAVYRARHVLLGTEHAVKVILPELAQEDDIVARMTREAITLHDVNNDAVVKYEGFFLDETGRRYLVMEYVDGPSLAAVLRERRLNPEEVRVLRDRLALGLAAAHDQGVQHRDMSPDNIILPGGRIEQAKIIDFGIAKSKKGGEHTVVGAGFIGKYSYAAPEQFEDSVEPDGRSDIYSLGLVLAAAAIGHGGKLDMGNSLASAVKARQSVPDLSAVPEELRAELAAMLQPRREDRPQRMRDLVGPNSRVDAAAGEAFDGASDAQTRRDVAETRLRAPAPRGGKRALGVAGALAAALLLIAGGHVVYPRPLTRLFGPDETRILAEVQKALEGECPGLAATVSEDFLFRTHVRVTGSVATQHDIVTISQHVAGVRGVSDVDAALRVDAWPFCVAVNMANGTPPAAAPKITAAVQPVQVAEGKAKCPPAEADRSDKVFKAGQCHVLSVASPGMAGLLYVDLLDADGNVQHIFHGSALAAGGTLSTTPFIVQEERQTYMVTAVLAKQPLFDDPQQESGDAMVSYLNALRAAVKKARDTGGPDAVAVNYRIFEVAGQ